MGKDDAEVEKSVSEKGSSNSDPKQNYAANHMVFVDHNQKELNPTSESRPMKTSQTIGKLHFNNCSGNNVVGDQIIANNVIIQNITPTKSKELNIIKQKKNSIIFKDELININRIENNYTKNSTRKCYNKLSRRKIMFSVVFAVMVILTTSLILTLELNANPRADGNQTTTTMSPIITTTTTERVPANWFINVSQWSMEKTPVDNIYAQSMKNKLAIDDTDTQSCHSLNMCKNVLTELQSKPRQSNNTNYNYLIGGDGRVYEGRGNNYPSDRDADYNGSYVKVGFIGTYRDNSLSNMQIDVFQKLVSTINAEGQLEDIYKIIPQCCRNRPGENGPSKNIITYFYYTYIDTHHWTEEYCQCVDSSISSTTTDSSYWWQ